MKAGKGIMGIMEMLLWVADENAQALRERERSRQVIARVTAVELEKQEWSALNAKIQRRKQLLGDDVLEMDEDEGEALEVLVSILSRSKRPLTGHEVMRQMQRFGTLSREFPAAARQQTLALLHRLRVANRVWQDTSGRWSLL